MKRVSSDAAGGRQAGAEDENTQVAEAERGAVGKGGCGSGSGEFGDGRKGGTVVTTRHVTSSRPLIPGPQLKEGSEGKGAELKKTHPHPTTKFHLG